jgi:hypothetical protein
VAERGKSGVVARAAPWFCHAMSEARRPTAQALLLAALLAGAMGTRAAHAAGLVTTGGETMAGVAIREDHLLFVDDGRSQRLFYAARVEPATGSLRLLVPTAGAAADVAARDLDLPAVMHALVAALSERSGKPAPVSPAPWATHGATASAGLLRSLADAGLTADARTWAEGLAPRFPGLAALQVRAPADGRIEVLTPTLEVRWPGRSAAIAWSEPAPAPHEPAPDAARPSAWEALRVDDIERSTEAAPSPEALARILRGRRDPARACHAAFIEARPGEPAAVRTRIIVNRRGDTITAVSVPVRDDPEGTTAGTGAGAAPDAGPRDGAAAALDPAREALAKCVAKVLRETQLPRIDEEYEVRVTVRFDAPPVPPRRTHLLLLARERLRWASPPPQVQLLREGEATAREVEAALPAVVRDGLDADPGARWWAAEYLDTSQRRATAADVALAIEPLPAPDRAAPRPTPATKAPKGERRPGARRLARAAMGVVAAVAVALALLLAREPRRRG